MNFDNLDLDITGRGYYTLDDEHHAVPATSLLTWARWFEESRAKRIVKQESVGVYFVSTVFIGLDHSFSLLLFPEKAHAPHLFETMAFLHVGDDRRLSVQERCSTWDEAEAQHAAIVEKMRIASVG